MGSRGQGPGRNDARSLFADIYEVANSNTIFSHIANLYNLYVYFWRWSIWKAFEAHGDGPGIVALITGASWLTGPGFMGLRQLVRELCDEAWVIDLGGDNRGANPEDNVFAIETPVAVVVLVRDGTSRREEPAHVHYRRVRGTAEEKLRAMAAIASGGQPFTGEWIDAPSGWLDPFVPITGDTDWTDLPSLTNIFPWQQPGCKYGRTWPIGPSPEILEGRWRRFVGASRQEKKRLFFTASSGRNIETRVDPLPVLADAVAGTPHQPIVRYGYRSFDRQWAFADPRMAKTDSPSLWQSVSTRQVFFTSLLTGHLSFGPSLTVAAYVPDLHSFRGSYGGKDVVPLYRDALGREPNVTTGLLPTIGSLLGIDTPSPEDIAAYVYALLSSTAYQERFSEELRTPGPRVPITGDPALWGQVVGFGRELIWLHTYAERFRETSHERGGHVPLIEGIGWTDPVTIMPADPSAIAYDDETHTLTVGDGCISNVRPEVWAYEVSGMQVVSKWLGYRTVRAPGRAASSTSALDQIRPTAWPDDWNDELLDLIRILTITLDRQAELADLLERVCNGPLILASDLPVPSRPETQPPATVRASTFDFG